MLIYKEEISVMEKIKDPEPLEVIMEVGSNNVAQEKELHADAGV